MLSVRPRGRTSAGRNLRPPVRPQPIMQAVLRSCSVNPTQNGDADAVTRPTLVMTPTCGTFITSAHTRCVPPTLNVRPRGRTSANWLLRQTAPSQPLTQAVLPSCSVTSTPRGAADAALRPTLELPMTCGTFTTSTPEHALPPAERTATVA